MTTPIAHCIHCQRPAPAEDDPDFLHWEVLDDSDMVCPDCETPEEKQAIDDEDMRLADGRLTPQNRQHLTHCGQRVVASAGVGS